MESYYDSDEEIAWGPVTLRELKSDLKRPVIRLPKRRHTVLSSFEMDASPYHCDRHESQSEDVTTLCQDVANKVNVSETSTEYYTPNESLRSEINSGFLEKISKVINEHPIDLSCTSAFENTKASVTTDVQFKNESENLKSPYLSLVNNRNNVEDSCFNFLKGVTECNTTYNIANFQQSLVENSVLLSDDERVVTDELEYSDSEDKLHEDLRCKNRHTLVQSLCEDKNTHEGIIIPHINPIIEEKESLSTSPIIIPVIDLTQFDDSSSKIDSPQFNDTLEEMNRLLKQGNRVPQIYPTIEGKESSNTLPITIPKIVITQFDDSISMNDSLEMNDTFDNAEISEVQHENRTNFVKYSRAPQICSTVEEKEILITPPITVTNIVLTEVQNSLQNSISKNDSLHIDNTLDNYSEISEEMQQNHENTQNFLEASQICSTVEGKESLITSPVIIPEIAVNQFHNSVLKNDNTSDDYAESAEEQQQIHFKVEEKQSLSYSPITIPEIDTTQFHDPISNNDSLQLNDTIEEMNRLLSQGLNYTMSDEESIIEDTPVKKRPKPEPIFTPCNIISGSFSQNHPVNFLKNKEKVNRLPVRIQSASAEKRQINKFNMITSPVTNFKVPETPVRSKVMHPTPPKSCSNHLKNIVSPVALYIKNSPSMTLKQNIPQRELSKIVATKNQKPSSKEDFAGFPEVVYKPSKKQITSNEKVIILPPSFKKLNIKEPSITKHEGRINQNLNKSKVNRKLLQCDITDSSIDASILNNSRDISVLTNKQAFIK